MKKKKKILILSSDFRFRFRPKMSIFVFGRKWNFIFVGIFVYGRKWKMLFASKMPLVWYHKKGLGPWAWSWDAKAWSWSWTLGLEEMETSAKPSKNYIQRVPPTQCQSTSASECLTRGQKIRHDPNPVYLRITLDRSLTFRDHLRKTAAKAGTHNNLLSMLAGSSWGAFAPTFRTSALALCYSVAEYCTPVWFGQDLSK